MDAKAQAGPLQDSLKAVKGVVDDLGSKLQKLQAGAFIAPDRLLEPRDDQRCPHRAVHCRGAALSHPAVSRPVSKRVLCLDEGSEKDAGALTHIAGQLEFVDTNPSPSRAEVLERLKSGEITAEEAIRALEALK